MTQKRYHKQFKVAAAKAILSGEMSVNQFSSELGVKNVTFRRRRASMRNWKERHLLETVRQPIKGL